MKHLGHLEIALGAALMGSVGLFVNHIQGLSLPSMAFYRVFIGSTILIGILLALGRGKAIRGVERRHLPYLALLGVLLALTIIAYFYSIRTTTMAHAVLLLYTAPVWVAILSPLLLKERPSLPAIIALILSIMGITLMVGPSNLSLRGTYTLGLLAGLLSGVAYGVEMLISRHLGTHGIKGYSQALYGNLTAAVVLIPFAIRVPLEQVTPNLSMLFLLGLLPTALAMSLYFDGFKRVSATRGSITGMVEPVAGVGLATVVLHEPLTLYTTVGGALILLGVLIVIKTRATQAH